MSAPTSTGNRKTCDALRKVMSGKGWMTLHFIRRGVCEETGEILEPQTISARVRDLRKPQYGGHQVQRRPHPRQRRVYQYRLVQGEEA